MIMPCAAAAQGMVCPLHSIAILYGELVGRSLSSVGGLASRLPARAKPLLAARQAAADLLSTNMPVLPLEETRGRSYKAFQERLEPAFQELDRESVLAHSSMVALCVEAMKLAKGLKPSDVHPSSPHGNNDKHTRPLYTWEEVRRYLDQCEPRAIMNLDVHVRTVPGVINGGGCKDDPVAQPIAAKPSLESDGLPLVSDISSSIGCDLQQGQKVLTLCQRTRAVRKLGSKMLRAVAGLKSLPGMSEPSTLLHLIHRCPALLATCPVAVRETWVFLHDVLGMGEGVLVGVVQEAPRILTVTPSSLKSKVAVLYSHFKPVHLKDVITGCPGLMAVELHDLVARIEYLRNVLGVQPEYLLTCPCMLMRDVEKSMKPRLAFVEQLGYKVSVSWLGTDTQTRKRLPWKEFIASREVPLHVLLKRPSVAYTMRRLAENEERGTSAAWPSFYRAYMNELGK